MTKTLVVFQTAAVSVEPDTEGPFARMPQTRRVQYLRHFDLDLDGLWVLKKITFYGDEYQISSYGISSDEIGITVTDAQLATFLAKAEVAGDEWEHKVENTIDARQLMREALYRDRASRVHH